MRVAVVLNTGAGSSDPARCKELAERIQAAFTALSVDAEVHACKGVELAPTARRLAASGVDAVVAAGGDGTVSTVACALVGGEVPVAVLPLGTLNHFARDLGMPLDLDAAVAAIASGGRARLDVGEVNGRCFVNNASIGLYPEMVMQREQQRRQVGRGKWLAMVLASLRVLRRFPLLRVRVETAAGVLESTTPFVFIGNNDYETSALSLGRRARLDRGQLSLYMIHCRGRFHMFWLMVRALMQRLEALRDFEYQRVDQVTVRLSRHRPLEVSFDGEVARMQSPLRFRIRAGALPVVLPPASEAALGARAEEAA
jgi:diacylglycerol kinase family enzyme